MPRLTVIPARRRTLLAAIALFALAFVVGAALTPSPTEAQTRCGTEILYWDESWSEVVGIRGWLPEHCGCQYYYWGTFTANRIYQDSWC